MIHLSLSKKATLHMLEQMCLVSFELTELKVHWAQP